MSASTTTASAAAERGRVRVDVWERDGQAPSVSWIVDATFVGHDLNRGSTQFSKASRTAAPDPIAEEVRELVHSYDPVGPRLDADGNAVAQSDEPAA